MAKLSILITDDELHALHGLAHDSRLKFQPMVRGAVLGLLAGTKVPASPKTKVGDKLASEIALIERAAPATGQLIRALISATAKELYARKGATDATEHAIRGLEEATREAGEIDEGADSGTRRPTGTD